MRQIARKRLPAGVFDYIDGWAEDEVRMGRDTSAFGRYVFRPRVLRNVGDVDSSTSLMGHRLSFPLVLAPTGFTRILDRQGELAVARAADRANIPYVVSTLSTRSVEEVAAVSNGPLWFQIYAWRDRALLAEMVLRAKEAQYSAIVLTVDAPVLGQRERDTRRGFTLPPKIGLDTIYEGVRHPSWTAALLRAEPIILANVRGRMVGDGSDPISLASYVNTQFDPRLSWKDVDWLRSKWDGPIVLKGIHSLEDALLAREIEVDAIALSNHGGRQLEGAPAPIDLIADVRQSVGESIAIICDGGIRRGSDIVKAVALGASSCMAGRA